VDRCNLLWGITGSVAAIRAGNLAYALMEVGRVQAVVTERAKHFLEPLPPEVTVHDDAKEWSLWRRLGDPVLHIELRRWADVFVIAPASADCMAKLATGICDNLLLSVARAWEFPKPMIVAPAMNTRMWEHPSTAAQLSTLRSWGVEVVDPVEKTLACDDFGLGALAPPEAIVAALRRVIGRQ
jgi:phosphopantothenoylcysteine decarboxylase